MEINYLFPFLIKLKKKRKDKYEKKILSLLGTIALIGTSTTSLVACNTPQEYKPEELAQLKKENQINTTNETIKNNLEWIAPQEKPFKEIGNNKYYFIM